MKFIIISEKKRYFIFNFLIYRNGRGNRISKFKKIKIFFLKYF